VFDFSKDELLILELLGQGLSEFEISQELGIDLPQYRTLWQHLADKVDWHEPRTPLGMAQALAFERARRASLLAQLNASESRLHALMNLSPNGIVVVDGRTGKIRQANEQAATLFGYTVDGLLGMEVEQLVPPDQRDLHIKQRLGFLRSIRKREIGYHPPIFALKIDGKRIEVVIGLIATSATDDVMVICRDLEAAIAAGVKSAEGNGDPRTP
jgi:PAS domain S-box-containing protein